MTKLSQKVEQAANVLIIIAAILLIGFIAKKHILSFPATQHERIHPTIGSKVNLPDVSFSNQPKTLILALQTGCRFCNESAPFYKHIIESVRGKNLKLVAAFPTSIEESAAHLRDLGLDNVDVRRSPLDVIKVGGTPTLILVNEKGEVTDFWVGKLTPDKETEVIDKLIS